MSHFFYVLVNIIKRQQLKQVNDYGKISVRIVFQKIKLSSLPSCAYDHGMHKHLVPTFKNGVECSSSLMTFNDGSKNPEQQRRKKTLHHFLYFSRQRNYFE